MSDTSYIVLARKHRPRHFNEVVGQGHVARTLSNAIRQNRVAHALLFSGPRGVGKTSTARILARALNCHQGPTPTPCDQCPACSEVGSGASVDVIEIDAASNRGIDEIRDLREAVRYPPSRERFKVYIIDEVHMLTTPAFNALLKTLEEPPPHVIFVFATTEPHKIPDTILSRCQRFDFRRISADEIQSHLADIAALESVEADAGALRMIAEQSEGCMRDAQSQLDQLISFSDGRIDADLTSRVLGVIGRDALFRLSHALLGGDVDGVLAVVEEAYSIGANLVTLTSDLLRHLRDLTVVAVSPGRPALPRYTESERDKLDHQAEMTEPSVLHRMFTVLLDTATEMKQSGHPRLLLEMALIRMTAIEPLEPVAHVVARLEQLVSGGTPPGSSTPPPRSPTTPSPGRGAPTAGPSASPGEEAAPASPPGGHFERWTQLVSEVMGRSALVGNTLKVAELQDGGGDQFEARLAGAQLDIISSDDKLQLIDRAAKDLFGEGASVELAQRGESAPPATSGEPTSVSGAEEAEMERERERLAEIIRNHPATALLRDTFEPTSVQIRPLALEPQPAQEVDP